MVPTGAGPEPVVERLTWSTMAQRGQGKHLNGKNYRTYEEMVKGKDPSDLHNEPVGNL